MPKRDLLSILDLNPDDILRIIDRSIAIAKANGRAAPLLAGSIVGIYFRQLSTRTRTSFTAGAMKLGANVIPFGPNDLQVNSGESLQDTGRILAGYIDALVIRTADSIADLRTLAEQKSMAVINAMTENEHPTQALADLSTIKHRFGRLSGLNVLYVGEGNNTATALALAMSRLPGVRLTLATPEKYGVPLPILEQAQEFGKRHGAQIIEQHSVDNLPGSADVVYTTRWQTTGTSKADQKWREKFAPFRVTRALMEIVSKPSGTVFMHDLPAVRGEDVESDVLEGPQSIAFEQAQFKMYSAMAILEWCLRD